MVISTIAASFLTYLAILLIGGGFNLTAVVSFFITQPIIFFATVMVTEPLSTPPGKRNHILYGSLVGALASIPFDFGVVSSSLALALLIGNVAFYPTTLKGRIILQLKEIKQIAKDTYEYIFVTSQPIHFKDGQYLEWTLPHKSDARGIRRYFTLSSAPSDIDVRVAMKQVSNGSTFKKQLREMSLGDKLYATSIGGDFILPENKDQPVVWLAGGIGVTPFVSMTREALKQKTFRPATLFYCNNLEADIAYADLWQQAEQALKLKVINVLSKPPTGWSKESGYISSQMIKKYVEKFIQAKYYISGPPAMVSSYKKLLLSMNIPRRNIVTDYFPGLG